MCTEHNFIHDEFDDTFNTILLINFIFPQFQSSHSQIFNSACSNKIAQVVVDMSLIDSGLYFLAIQKIRDMIRTIYENIETATRLDYTYGHPCYDSVSGVDIKSNGVIILAELQKNMEYTISDINNKDNILKHIQPYFCDFCNTWFINKHLVAVEYDENLKIIYKKCVNCRTLELSTDYIINFLHQQSSHILQKYLEIVRITDYDTDRIILSYLFGTKNVQYIGDRTLE